MPKNPPEFRVVKFGEIVVWGKNPRQIEPEKLIALANSLKKYGLFQNLTCWMEGEKYVTGGGNMRYKAMKEILKWPADKDIQISVNFPESEAEKLELSFLDNQTFGFYNELEVANLIRPEADKLDLDILAINIGPPVGLEAILTDFNEDEAKVPLVDNVIDDLAITSRIPISGDLNVVGVGAYCCIISRIVTDEVVELLKRKFGDNRSERKTAGEWMCALMKKTLIPLVGKPSPVVEKGKPMTEARKQERADRKEVEDKEHKEWVRKQEAKAKESKKQDEPTSGPAETEETEAKKG